MCAYTIKCYIADGIWYVCITFHQLHSILSYECTIFYLANPLLIDSWIVFSFSLLYTLLGA